jgi:5,10-methylenetetrahydromethanopterin reductase
MPVREAAANALKAEASGYESFWMHESLFQRDVVTYISSIAASTSRILVASGVTNTFTRHPVTTASTFATLSELSGGRTILGLGLGSFPTMPLIGQSLFPVAETKPLRRIREYVAIVRSIWSGEKVDFDGEFFKVRGLQLGFKLEHKIPLYIGSLSPMVQRFAGRAADGVILSPSLMTPRATGGMVANVAAGESESGRRIERASYMLTSVARDRETARKAVRSFYFFLYQLAEVVKPQDLEAYGVTEEQVGALREAWRKGDLAEAARRVPDGALDALAVAGTPDQAAERIAEYTKVGVTLPIVMPIGDVGFALESLAPGARRA